MNSDGPVLATVAMARAFRSFAFPQKRMVHLVPWQISTADNLCGVIDPKGLSVIPSESAYIYQSSLMPNISMTGLISSKVH